MSIPQVIQLGRHLLYTAMLLALPAVAVSLVVGLVVSVFQTVTSIQEQTLSYAPRIVAVGLVFAFTLPWTLKMFINFTVQMLWYAAEVGP